MDKEDQKVQTSNYKIHHGEVMYSITTTVDNVLHIWKLLRMNLKGSQYKKICGDQDDRGAEMWHSPAPTNT